MHSFSVYYIEANLVCVIVFGILLLHNYFNIDRQEKQIKFDHVLIAFILYFVTDCFWAAIVDGVIPKTRFSIVSNVFLTCVLMSAITYFWLDYVMAFEQIPKRNDPVHRFAVFFPFLLSTVAMVLHYIIAPDTLVSDTLDTLPAYNIYLVTVPYIYMAAILFYTIRRASKEENPLEKRKHLFVGLFPLMVIVGGIIQMVFFPQLPIFCFTCLILMLIFYIQSIERRVSLDPLTNLNNRGQLARYISQPSNLRQEGRLTFVLMMDIDEFKTINDTYGHAEGDKALVLVSDSLKKVVNSHNTPSFLCRFGGDEFILILHPHSEEEVHHLIEEIREQINEFARGSSYPILISAGYAEYKGGAESFQVCLKNADKRLYQDKKSRKLKSKIDIN